MAFSSTTLHTTLGRINPIAAANLPAGYLSTFAQSVAGNAGANAFSMDQTGSNTVLAGQRSYNNNSFSTIPTGTNQDIGLAQFISSPLTAQSISSSSSWSFYAAAQVSNATASFTWTFRHALYLVNGTGGTIKTTIVSLSNLGATARSGTGELGVVSTTISGLAFTPAAGDFLIWEWGLNINNTSGGSLAPNITIYTDGITQPTDNSASTNAETKIVAPVSLSFTPIVRRAQVSNPPVLQYRAPGFVRTQLTNPPIMQYRGPGFVRTQFSNPPVLQSRTGDVHKVLMRGFDSSLSRIVYWTAGASDPTGAQYSGDQTKLSDIVMVSQTNVTGT